MPFICMFYAILMIGVLLFLLMRKSKQPPPPHVVKDADGKPLYVVPHQAPQSSLKATVAKAAVSGLLHMAAGQAAKHHKHRH